jgi:hypothetical protein
MQECKARGYNTVVYNDDWYNLCGCADVSSDEFNSGFTTNRQGNTICVFDVPEDEDDAPLPELPEHWKRLEDDISLTTMRAPYASRECSFRKASLGGKKAWKLDLVGQKEQYPVKVLTTLILGKLKPTIVVILSTMFRPPFSDIRIKATTNNFVTHGKHEKLFDFTVDLSTAPMRDDYHMFPIGVVPPTDEIYKEFIAHCGEHCDLKHTLGISIHLDAHLKNLDSASIDAIIPKIDKLRVEFVTRYSTDLTPQEKKFLSGCAKSIF